MIEFKGIDFSYDERPVLSDVSFRVAEAESLVIMGPSGSGKSTILRLILGLECPQRGEILIDGQNICHMKERQKQEIRKKMGMVFQDGALFDSLSVWENVGYYLLEHTKLSTEEIGRRSVEMLGFVGLDAEDVVNKLPEHLSGGMQRRVAIGRALLSTDPRIMLFDEPTTGLDPQSTENVLNLIRKLRREKAIATIVVTHQIADAIAIADRYVVIIDGRVAFDGTLNELRECPHEGVRAFLAPFKTSFTGVADRNFI